MDLTSIALGAIAMALAGCAGADTKAQSPAAPQPEAETASQEPSAALASSGLLGEPWNVIAYGDGPALKGVYNSMEFRPDEMAGGRAACNAWRGPVEIGVENMRFGPAISTMMACPESAMIAERRFLSALPQVRRYSIKDGALILSDSAGGAVMRLTRDPWPKGLDTLPKEGVQNDATG